MKALTKFVFFMIFLSNLINGFHFDFNKKGEKCIIEEFFVDTVI
jgi:hypothetical protein